MKKIEIDEFLRIKAVSNPCFSPDGKTIAFVQGEPNKDENTYKKYIYVIKEDGSIVKLTNGGKEGSLQFISNTEIMFRSDRSPKEGETASKFYKININGGEAEELLNLPINVNKLEPLGDGKYILSAGTSEKYPIEKLFIDADLREKKAKEEKENEDYEVLNTVPFYFNGSGFDNGETTSCICLYDANTKELKALTSKDQNIEHFELSRDKKWVYLFSSKPSKWNKFYESDLLGLNISSGEQQLLLSHKDYGLEGFVPADDGFYFLAHHWETGLNTDIDFYFYSFKTKEALLASKFERAIGSSVGSDVRIGGGSSIKLDKDGTLYFAATVNDSSYVYSLKNGEIKQLLAKDGSADALDVCNGRVIVSGLYDMNPVELYELRKEDYANGPAKELRKLTSFNSYLDEYYIAKPEYFEFQSDVDVIHGFVLKPIDFDKNKKYPVILDIHGGPKTVYGPVFYHEMQYWTSEGYFVIYCNPSGSDGRGRRFADMRGNYGKQDFADIMHFCDEALARYPQMDKERFYETGGSYGGFMTNWIIGHTDRFRACASQRSISNWTSFYGTSDIGPGFAVDQVGANMWDNLDQVWWHSPLKYAKDVKTPTLFIHSNEDFRCPMEQGMQMYSALITNGIDSKLVYFKGENHELSRSGKPTHRLRRLSEITEWFKKH